MTDNRIRSLVNNFRKKIDRAQRKDLFVDTILEEFPIQCCGVTSRLLAEFLLGNGVETLWISAEEFGTHETHALRPQRACNGYLCGSTRQVQRQAETEGTH